MVGKASLIVILGFSLLFGVASQYWNRTSNRAIENLSNYYDSTVAHNIAVSIANLAVDSLFQNTADTTMSALTGYFPVPSGKNDGSYKAVFSMQTGAGGIRNPYIVATSSYTGWLNNKPYSINDTVTVLLSYFAFSRYAFFTGNDNGVYWTTGDTLTGPLQTNGNLYVDGVPVVHGPVTIGGTTYSNHHGALQNPVQTNLPDSYGDTLKCNSFRPGVSVPLPKDLSGTTKDAIPASIFSQSNYAGSNYAYDVYLKFNADGTVTETDTTRQLSHGNWSVVAKSANQNIALSSLVNPATNKTVIEVSDGDVHVSGVVNGDVTVVATQGATPGATTYRRSSTNTSNPSFSTGVDGNVLITGPITYNSNPQSNPSSTDMLGLVANNDVMLTSQSTDGNITIDAAIFAMGSFTFQDYSSDKGTTSNGTYNTFKGYLNVYGSISQNSRGGVGAIVNGTAYGYLKDYKYDSRFAWISPPSFPGTTPFRVIAWRE